jgi:uncharacterized protein (DUF2062 family)
MIHATRAAIARWLERLLHIHDSPHRTALAFALGVLLGFSPALGLHTILGIILAFVLNLNRVAVLLGIYSNLPWIIAQYYVGMTAAGAWLLGVSMPAEFASRLGGLFGLSLLDGRFWQQLGEMLQPLFWPYVVGSALGALVLSAVAYPIARAFIATGHRYAEHRHLHHPRQGGQP